MSLNVPVVMKTPDQDSFSTRYLPVLPVGSGEQVRNFSIPTERRDIRSFFLLLCSRCITTVERCEIRLFSFWVCILDYPLIIALIVKPSQILELSIP